MDTSDTYDELHRCISKKLPGVDAVTIQYDDADRPVFSQTGVQKASGTATQMSYDPFGRLSSKSDGTQSLKVFYDNYDFMSNKPSLGYVQKAGYGNRADNVIGLQTGEIVSAEVGKELYSVCYYDKKGQLVQKRSENHLGGLDCYYYLYTYTGKVASMLHEHIVGSSKQEEIYSYVYDNADRLLQVSHQLNSGEKVTLMQNVYDRLCRLSSQKVFGKENISYEYNIREWPTSISSENYKETLSYYGGNYRMYGGNVTSMTWSVGNETLVRKYNFSYDTLYRLTYASYLEDNAASGHYDTRYTYDLMGNMLTLKRNGLQDGGTYGAIDNVSFIYKGNQMLRADDNVEDPTYKDAWNFVDGASENIEYEYDKNGNMVKDLNKGIQSISYNSLNLPTQIKFEGGKNISYVYDANGKKLQASYTTSLPSTSMTLDYCDNMVYENGVLSQILVDGGYISFTNGKPVYHYYLKDHLGSNRVVVNHTTGEVEQVNHYYPFGGLMAESTGGSVQRYKYNGKELDGMHGLDSYDYEARWYDSSLDRWLSQDPMASDYSYVSPYVYCLNNSINAIDTDGKRVRTILYIDNKTPKYYNSTVEFHKAMSYFAKTSFGQQLFADFTPVNSTFFGVKGNGKYSDYDLNLYEISDSDPQSRTAFFKGINAQTKLMKSEQGKPTFSVVFDTERGVGDLLETIAHELAGHLSKYTNVLNAYEKTQKYVDAKREWEKSSETKEHQEMKDKRFQNVNVYQKVLMELFLKYPYFNNLNLNK